MNSHILCEHGEIAIYCQTCFQSEDSDIKDEGFDSLTEEDEVENEGAEVDEF